MKIAFVVPYVPNLIRTRPYNLIIELTLLGHHVEVFTMGSSKQDEWDAQALKTKCRDVHYHVQPVWRSLANSAMAVPSSQPLQSVYSWHSGMARNIATRVSRKEFDILHVEHLRGSRYGLFIKSGFPCTPVVWDSVDCISYLFRQATGHSTDLFGRFVTRFELSRTKRAEGKLICTFDHVLVTSPADREALSELVPNGKSPSPISVLPNGVDLAYFRPNPAVQRDPATIVFSGKMSYHANITMAKYLVAEIMPRVWSRRPDARLLIVGKDPPPDIQMLAHNPLVSVTGTVDDIRPFLWRASVAVVPLLYGAGIQNKVLEAMATGTTVISTSAALAALRAQPGRDLLVADHIEGIAQAILRVIEDRDLNTSIGNSGLGYVRTSHKWKSAASRIAVLYRALLDRMV